jgi:hypothetical protein
MEDLPGARWEPRSRRRPAASSSAQLRRGQVFAFFESFPAWARKECHRPAANICRWPGSLDLSLPRTPKPNRGFRPANSHGLPNDLTVGERSKLAGGRQVDDDLKKKAGPSTTIVAAIIGAIGVVIAAAIPIILNWPHQHDGSNVVPMVDSRAAANAANVTAPEAQSVGNNSATANSPPAAAPPPSEPSISPADLKSNSNGPQFLQPRLNGRTIDGCIIGPDFPPPTGCNGPAQKNIAATFCQIAGYNDASSFHVVNTGVFQHSFKVTKTYYQDGVAHFVFNPDDGGGTIFDEIDCTNE